MRRPPRNPFHHSDLGGAYLAFAPKFCEYDQNVTRGPLSDDHCHTRRAICGRPFSRSCRLAAQLDFISPDRLRAALHTWTADKARALGEILLHQKQLLPRQIRFSQVNRQRHTQQRDAGSSS